MDRRSWPWKKKSSDKAASSIHDQAEKESDKAEKYAQVSQWSYAQLAELEDQVKYLNQKLKSALIDAASKEDLAKQHAKVAEDAVSGWEKAEAEALTLKNQLENVMLQKLSAEERASNLDGALKECMKQIRNVREEGERKLEDFVLSKTKQWEKVKSDAERSIASMEQELVKASTENSMLKRSLQERTNVLMKVSDEKAEAESEIEALKSSLQSCEKETSYLRYELHVASKELEIRNGEKHLYMKSADVASKQRAEDSKKIVGLEAECQRLRLLVRKKLPGPAALSQMKQEVESLGRGNGEIRTQSSPARHSSPRRVSGSHFPEESVVQQLRKENNLLSGELQASRSMLATTMDKLHSLEANVMATRPKALKAGNTGELDHIEDFLEMERLARSSAEKNGLKTAADGDEDDETSAGKSSSPLSNLHSVTTSILHPRIHGPDIQEELQSKEEHKSLPKTKQAMKPELKGAISQLHGLLLSLGKEPSRGGMAQDFSASGVLDHESFLDDFVVGLSKALCGSDQQLLRSSTLDKHYDGDGDCVDKATLLENTTAARHEPSSVKSSAAGSESGWSSTDKENAEAKYVDLKDDTERKDERASCKADTDVKAKEEREIAEKLSECQETMLVLSRQLNAIRRPSFPSSGLDDEDESILGTRALLPGSRSPHQAASEEPAAAAWDARRHPKASRIRPPSSSDVLEDKYSNMFSYTKGKSDH